MKTVLSRLLPASRPFWGAVAVVLTGVVWVVGCRRTQQSTMPIQSVPAPTSAIAASEEVVTDADGNIYRTVRIGSQVWTVENLRTTRYNDGTPIPQVTDPQEWTSLSTAAFCCFDNNPEHGRKNGVLYNWFAASTERIAPKGWRVPTHDEQLAMRQYLIASGYNFDGTTEGNKVAKSLATTSEWPYRDRDAYGNPTPDAVGMVGNNPQTNNRSGFSALPAGSRWYDGSFHAGDTSVYWWSVTPQSDTDGYHTSVHTWFAKYGDNHHDKRTGFSIRLIRDSGDR